SRGRGGTGRGLRGNFLNNVHGVGNVTCRSGLLARRVGNVLDQVSEVFRYALNFFQCHTGVLRQASTLHHLGGGLFHRDNRFVGIGLNGFYQRFDLLGCRGGTFSKALYFVRNHREAPACFTGHGRLDRRVKSQDVGLVSNVVNQRYDVTNLLGRFTQTLDTFRGFLDLFANRVHAVDRCLYHLGTLVRDCYRSFRNRGRFGGVGRYLVNRHRHFVHSGGSTGNFLRLVLGRFGKVHSRGLRFLGSRCHLYRGLVNGLYQAAQLVNGEVDGVGDRTGEVLGYRRLYRQVTVSEVAQLVEQTQNGGLVTLVFRFQFFLATACVLGTQYENGCQQRNRDSSKQEAGVQVREDTAGGFLELGVQGG